MLSITKCYIDFVNKILISIVVRTVFNSAILVLSAAGLITLAIPTLSEFRLKIKKIADKAQIKWIFCKI